MSGQEWTRSPRRRARQVAPERLERARAELARCLRSLLARFPPGSLPGDPPWLVVRLGTERWSGEARPLGGVPLWVEDDLAGSVERVLTVLLHKLVHLALARRGLTSGGVGSEGGDHTPEFGHLAQAVGLEVHPHPILNTGDTRPSPALQELFAGFALAPEEVLLGEPGAALRRFGRACYSRRDWRGELLPEERELLGDAAPPEPESATPGRAPVAAAGRDGRPLTRRFAAWIGRRLPWAQGGRGGQAGTPGLLSAWERPAGFPAPRFRLHLSREPDPVRWAYPVLRSDREHAAWLWRLVAEYECEALAAIYLDDSSRLIGGLVAHVGNRDRVSADSRRLLAGALLCNAWRMAVGHNHPTESSIPSIGDRNFTRTFAQAAAALGVELVGHFVLTEGSFERADPE